MKDTPAPPAELLAPAGSFESFFAALEGGADAVYVGLKEFSARAKAKNFSVSDLSQLTRAAQASGRRLYVTLNTLIKEAELPRLVETLASLEEIGVDAIILQDLAVWKLARDHFPGLELHASTQLTVHNSAGVQMLERMGFTRAVLARELSLAEIAEIRRRTTLELEHFIHGALCFSFSGQCYFSSFLGGKSGNRGRCAQPCRRRHRYRQQQGYYFSTNDLSAIDLLPELQQAGICSLKIEGRMKSAEYVHKVVGAYRQVLDSPPAQRPQALRTAKRLLKESFGRLPTRGFLPGGQPPDIAIPAVKGATGRYLGELSRVRGAELTFKSKSPLQIGDRLRIQPASDKAGSAFTLRQLQLGRNQVKKVSAGSQVTVIAPFMERFRPGDGVFLVSSREAFTLSDAACRRKLSQFPKAAEGVRLELECSAEELRLRARVGEGEFPFVYPIESFPARARALEKQTLEEVFSATADAPFTLEQLSCGELPPIVIPPKRLKEIRRQLYADLRRLLQGERQRRRRERLARALEALPGDCDAGPPGNPPRQVRLQLRSVRDQRLLQNPQVDQIILPLSRQNLAQAGKLLRHKGQVIWDLPFILFDGDSKEVRHAVRQLHQAGFRHFRLGNLGHFPLFDGLTELFLFSSYRLFALNSQALRAWRELGIGDAELYIEDDRENLAQVAGHAGKIATSLTVYGSVPLITSRIALKNLRSDEPILSDRGDAYRLQQRQGLSWLRSETDFSFLARLGELQGFGCRHFVLDLSHLDPFGARARQVLDALGKGIDPPHSSPFNYDRTLE